MPKKLRRAVKAVVWFGDASGTWVATPLAKESWREYMTPCYIVPAAEYERLTRSTKSAKRRGK